MSSAEPRAPIESFDLLAGDRRRQRRVAGRRALHAVALVGLAAAGARRGGGLGWAGVGFGLALLARNVRVWLDAMPEWRKRSRVDLRRLLSKNLSDPVDRASADSFPASDGPAHEAR